MYGFRFAFQYSSACSIASHNSSFVSKRRPLRASALSCFHHGSMRFSHDAYLGKIELEFLAKPKMPFLHLVIYESTNCLLSTTIALPEKLQVFFPPIEGETSYLEMETRSPSLYRWPAQMHRAPNMASASIIRLKRSPMRAFDPLFSRIGFCTQRTKFIDTNDTGFLWWRQVKAEDGPLFSTNSGSCLSASWNQLCCLFQVNPSATSHLQMVAGWTLISCFSSKAFFKRVKVHNSNGYPKLLGFWIAKSSTLPRVSSGWVAGDQI